MLVLVAVALGVFLLARGFDGSEDATVTATETSSPTADDSDTDEEDETPVEPDGSEASTSTTLATMTTTTTAPPPVTHPPNEVKVAVVNGKGAPGLAGAAAAELNALGYATKAKNAVSFGMETSVIYYQPGYGDDAKAIAAALNAPADLINAAPGTILTLISDPSDVSDFHIFLVLAADDLIPITV